MVCLFVIFISRLYPQRAPVRSGSSFACSLIWSLGSMQRNSCALGLVYPFPEAAIYKDPIPLVGAHTEEGEDPTKPVPFQLSRKLQILDSGFLLRLPIKRMGANSTPILSLLLSGAQCPGTQLSKVRFDNFQTGPGRSPGIRTWFLGNGENGCFGGVNSYGIIGTFPPQTLSSLLPSHNGGQAAPQYHSPNTILIWGEYNVACISLQGLD
uniref:Uncharacterized protein n=1 Tax=Sphaerodactylus townsendi TaxID=933632 RepID=A0ACB8F373_9SAUR